MKQQMLRLIHSRYMLGGVFLTSVLESTVLPIALEILLLPLMQSRRDKMWRIATAASLGCVVGALMGYYFGVWLIEITGSQLMDALGGETQFEELKASIKDHGFWFIFMAGITPVPFQLAMIAAGAVKYPLGLYMIAIVTSRSIRYFGLVVLVWYFGDQAEQLVMRYKKPVLWGLAGVLVVFVSYRLVAG